MHNLIRTHEFLKRALDFASFNELLFDQYSLFFFNYLLKGTYKRIGGQLNTTDQYF